ncbi:arginine--tRNA ligase [archaeon]|jgi:arginyl-tRNA synthetase|nr:arginine--tRNA ligase [archaeon]MBT6698036.1 arginine--tRNA ligase [archaeon]
MSFKTKLILLLEQNTSIPQEDIANLLTTPPNPKLGDFAFPCFKLVDKQDPKNNNPKLASENLKKLLESKKLPNFIKETKVVGPYLNFFLSQSTLAKSTLTNIQKQKETYGHNTPDKKNHILIEFFHANTHKAVHIGHFRNICTGTSIAKLLEAQGHKVTRINYQGDVGPHVAKAMYAYMNLADTKKAELSCASEQSSLCKSEEPKTNKGIWIGKLYAQGSKAGKEDPKIAQKIKELNTTIYSHKNKEVEAVWQKTRQWCLDDLEEFYKEFGVKFDKLYFESETIEPAKKIFQELIEKKIAEHSEGAIIVNLEAEKLAIYVAITSQGNPTYNGKEVGLATIHQKDFKFDQIIHVTGSEQELFFKQAFKTYEKMNWDLAKKSTHVSYGLVTLPHGKMSSREGTVILYRELFDTGFEKAKEEIKKRHPDLNLGQTNKRARQICFAALKYTMLHTNNKQTIVFDWNTALDMEGNSGPYLQYAHARCNSILKKAKLSELSPADPKSTDFDLFTTDQEKQLILQLSKLQDTATESATKYKPYLLAIYTYELAKLFASFYAACQVIDENNKELTAARLLLTQSTKQVLKNALNLLGIEAPEQM